MKEVLIIIPAYNEEKNIGRVLDSITAAGIGVYADVLIVNDGSTDFTSFVARQHGANVVTNIINLGYGSALQLGYKYAVRHQYRYVIQMDADGQHDISNIQGIYDALRRRTNPPDIVIGSRFLQGATSFRTSFAKKIAIGVFRRIIFRLSKVRITDPTSGLQGLSWKAFIYYARCNCFDYRYPDANMILQMLMMGYTVEEIPAVMHPRTEGKSMHAGFIKPVKYMFLVMLSILNVRLRDLVFRMSKVDVLPNQSDWPPRWIEV